MPGSTKSAQRPRSSRRQAAGVDSSRGLLFTVLGEFVLPTGAAWTSSFIDVFNRLGVEEKTARQALMRTSADGWLSEGEPWVQESILGTKFSGSFRWIDRAAGTVLWSRGQHLEAVFHVQLREAKACQMPAQGKAGPSDLVRRLRARNAGLLKDLVQRLLGSVAHCSGLSR